MKKIIILLAVSVLAASCVKKNLKQIDSENYEMSGYLLEKYADSPYEYTIDAKSRFSDMSIKGYKDKDGCIEAEGFIKTAFDEPYRFNAVYDLNSWYEKKTGEVLKGDDPPDPSFIIKNCITETEPVFVSADGGTAKYSLNVNVAFIDPLNYECPGFVYVRDGSFIERITAEREGLSVEIRMKKTKREVREIKNINFVFTVSGDAGAISMLAERLEKTGAGYRKGGKIYLYDDETSCFLESAATDSLRFSAFGYIDPAEESPGIKYMQGDIRNTVSVHEAHFSFPSEAAAEIEGDGPLYSVNIKTDRAFEGELCCYTKNWAFKCTQTPLLLSVHGLNLNQADMLFSLVKYPYKKGKIEVKEDK